MHFFIGSPHALMGVDFLSAVYSLSVNKESVWCGCSEHPILMTAEHLCMPSVYSRQFYIYSPFYLLNSVSRQKSTF